MKIPLGKPYIKNDVVLSEITKVLDRRWISGGPAIQEFEQAVKRYNNDDQNDYIALSNATVGLELALEHIKNKVDSDGYYGGDGEVIVTSWSWVASAFSVIRAGLKPVWVDVNQYGVPDPDHIKRLISKNTLAIIVVHQMGVPADMDAINEIVKTHNIHCIEDAACAFGSEYKGKKIGNGNNIVVYSFQARKCLTTGEGGMLVIPPDFQHVSTEKTETSKWFRSMRAFGTTVSPLERDKANFLLKEQFDKVGTNYKMCDVQAAMGLAHLSYFDEELELRRAAGLYYNEKITSGFSGRATIANLIPDYCTKYNWQNYHILLNSKYDRDVIVDVLRKKDIGCKWDIQPIHLEPAVSDTSVILQQTELFGKHGLWLPFFAEITREQQDHVIKTLNEVLT